MILSVPSQLMLLFVGIIGIQVPVSSGFIAHPSGPAFSSIARPPHLSRYFSKRDGHDDLIQQCEDSVRNVVTGLLFSAVLLLSPPDNTCNTGSPSHIDWFVARADENQVTVDGTSKAEESLLTAPAQAPSEKQGVTVVEEVWSLVDKYFIDQSFNGQVRSSFWSAQMHVLLLPILYMRNLLHDTEGLTISIPHFLCI